MKAVILAGGLGTRISEESHLRPKPMIEIGGKPILWHIMKTYAHYGVNEFIICLGYKGYIIKEYFANYFMHLSDVTITLAENQIDIHESNVEDWKITLVDTGLATNTGGRIQRVKKYLDPEENFCLTYGDGVSDVNIKKLVSYHNSSNSMATLTAVQPPGRFGSLQIENEHVTSFKEKQLGDGGWINGGYFVLSPEIFSYLGGDETVWEREPLEKISSSGNLAAYKHNGFWYPMDTMRDNVYLNQLWDEGKAEWNVWSK